MSGFLNLDFKSFGAMLTNAFAGTPFLAMNARVGILGSSSMTKLLLNPFSGSYFSTNTKILDSFDVLIEGESKSLLDFGGMKIRGAFNKAPINDITQGIYDYFSNNVLGLIPFDDIKILNEEIDALLLKKKEVVANVNAERQYNIDQFNNAKNDLDNHLSFLKDLERRAKETWEIHESIDWKDFIQRRYYWEKTNELNGEIALGYIALEAKRILLDGLIWVSGLPPVELDPRISSIDADINYKVAQREGLSFMKNLDEQGRTVLKKLQEAWTEVGFENIIDVKKVEFTGSLGLFTDNYFDSKLLMTFLGEEVAFKSSIGINEDESLNLGAIFNSLQKPFFARKDCLVR